MLLCSPLTASHLLCWSYTVIPFNFPYTSDRKTNELCDHLIWVSTHNPFQEIIRLVARHWIMNFLVLFIVLWWFCVIAPLECNAVKYLFSWRCKSQKNKQNTWRVDVDYGTFKPSKTQGMYTKRDNRYLSRVCNKLVFERAREEFKSTQSRTLVWFSVNLQRI